MISQFSENQRINYSPSRQANTPLKTNNRPTLFKQNSHKQKQNSPMHHPINNFLKEKKDANNFVKILSPQKPRFINNFDRVLKKQPSQIIPPAQPFHINLIKVDSPKSSPKMNCLRQIQEFQGKSIKKQAKSSLLTVNDFYLLLHHQVLLDRQFTYWKNMITSQNSSKILFLATGRNILSSELEIAFQEFDPFAISRSSQFTPDKIASHLFKALEQSKNYWKKFAGRFSEDSIATLYVKMDSDNKGYVDLFDFVREVNIHSNQIYKIKDLYLMLSRLSNGKMELRFNQLRGFLCGKQT